ncbi:MAG: PAS domain S-box protein [Bryobacteraceae bacterium]|nr:PAS domain S-box protein [Bryobacteraceae bacterium]
MSLAQLGMEREAEVRRLRTLYQLLASLSQAGALENVYDAALAGLLDATSANRAAILLFDDDGMIRFKASRGLSETYQAAVTGHSPWSRGARDTQPIVVPDVLLEDSLAPYLGILRREGIGALAFVPLALDGGVIGKFMLYYDEPYTCSTDELEMAQAIAAHVALATERKRAERARLDSEQRLQAILDNSATIIFLKDVQGRYLLVNRRFEELFHVSKEEVVGLTDYDLFAAEIADHFRANDQAVLAAGKAQSIEERAPHDDGVHTYISIKFPLRGPDGAPVGVCGIGTDITERKRLELAAQHLAAIVESSDDAIVSKDLNGAITSWNKGAERILGYRSDEVLGRPIAMLAPPDHLNEMPEILNRIRQGLRVDHYETRRKRKDGRIIDVELTISPVRDATGQIVGASKIARDITGRKLAEQERALLHAREREARRTAELLNRVGPRLAAQLDLDKLVQEVTDIATALVGADFGALFHNVVNEKGESYMLYTLSGAPREAFAGFPMPRNTELFGPTYRGEAIVRCHDVTEDPRYGKNPPHYGMPEGHLPVVSYLAAPVVGRSGEVLGGLYFAHSEPGRFSETHESIVAGIAAQAAIAMDNARLFQQIQSAQSELKRSNEELRRANRDLEVFAYSASHDLQEPLRTVSLAAQFLERSCRDRLEGDDALFLGNIMTASRRMSALLEDLLTYTRATKHEAGPVPSVDAGLVLGEALQNLRAPIEETGATVAAAELPAVAIHANRLAQIFQNLISNAIKYRGDEAPRVTVSAEERGGWYVFSVADNGIGIEPEFAEQIFGLFKRLHSNERYPGSGIGLSICQRIIEQYGGQIWLEHSAVGSGSTFCFSVPRAPDARGGAAEFSAPERP